MLYIDLLRCAVVFNLGFLACLGFITLLFYRVNLAVGPDSRRVVVQASVLFSGVILLAGATAWSILNNLGKPLMPLTPIAFIAVALLDYGLFSVLRQLVRRSLV